MPEESLGWFLDKLYKCEGGDKYNFYTNTSLWVGSAEEDRHRIVLSLLYAALPVCFKDTPAFLRQSGGSVFDLKILSLMHHRNIIKMIMAFIYFYHCFQKQQHFAAGTIQ